MLAKVLHFLFQPFQSLHGSKPNVFSSMEFAPPAASHSFQRRQTDLRRNLRKLLLLRQALPPVPGQVPQPPALARPPALAPPRPSPLPCLAAELKEQSHRKINKSLFIMKY